MVPPADPAGAVAPRRSRWWMSNSSWISGAVLIAVAGIAWFAVFREAASVATHGDGMTMSDERMTGTVLGIDEAVGYVGSWGVMMAAMMLPSALPTIALYSTVAPSMAERHGGRAASTSLFAGTYVAVWLGTGIVAYTGSVAASALVDADAAAARLAPYAVATVLAGAGVYQFSPLKRVCLRQCRSPLSFLATRWRSGMRGAVRLGTTHAAYCMGCCWALMVVLVAAGAMALIWVLLIAALVFVEKVLPLGQGTARVTGIALVLLGLLVAVRPDLADTLRR